MSHQVPGFFAQGAIPRCQRELHDAVIGPLAALLADDQAGLGELLEVVGHRGLGQADRVSQVTLQASLWAAIGDSSRTRVG